MRVRPASDLPSFLLNPRLLLLNLFPGAHDLHTIEVTVRLRGLGMSVSTEGL